MKIVGSLRIEDQIGGNEVRETEVGKDLWNANTRDASRPEYQLHPGHDIVTDRLNGTLK